MALFQAKIGWKRLRKREKKNIVSFRPYRHVIENSKKNSEKIEKMKKIPLWPYFNPKSVGNHKTERK